MTGSLTTRKTTSGNEYFYVSLKYKDPKTGKWKAKAVKTGLLTKNNKRKATDMIPEIIRQHAYLEMPYIRHIDSDIRLCEYLDKWLADTESSVRRSTVEGYTARVKKIKEYFADADPKVREVTPAMMDAYFKHCLKYGKTNQKTGKPEPLAVRTVRSYKSILSSAFTQARIDGLLLVNPVDDVTVGKKANNKYKGKFLFLTEDEVTRLMHFLSEEYPRLLPIAFFGVYYGLRRSEILGLKWNAINEEKGIISIRHTVVRLTTTIASDDTKTFESDRDLDLFPTAIKCLDGLKKAQESDKTFYQKEYKNSEGYVFCWEDGHPYDPNYITKKFRQAMAAFGRPEITLHKLRHTCTSILIDKNWDIKKIQYWLGHEDIQTTLDIYAHYIRHQANAAGNDMESASDQISDLF